MRNIKLILILAIVFTAVGLFAQPATVLFKDATRTTYDYVLQEDPAYPQGYPDAPWMFAYYRSEDAVIDPLVNGEPTGDDTHVHTVDLRFRPVGVPSTVLDGLVIQPLPVPGGWPCNIYIRIFNADTFENATKYMEFHDLVEVNQTGMVEANILDYGWDEPIWNWIIPQSEDTYTYRLTVNGPEGFTVTGPNEVTGDMGETFTATETNTLLGEWTASDPGEGYFWVNPVIEVTADMFEEPALTRADYEYFAAITFEREPIPVDTNTYYLTVNGPEGVAVTGPGEFAGFMGETFEFGPAEEGNGLIGEWTAGDAPEGFHWLVNPIEVTEDDFSQPMRANFEYFGSITFELEADPDPDTFTYHLTVLGPEGYTVAGPGEYAGPMGETFTVTETNDLIGMWTASDAPEGWSWVVNPIEVTEDDFQLPGEEKAVDYAYYAEIEFVLLEDEIPEPDDYTYRVKVHYDPSGLYDIWVPNPQGGQNLTDGTRWDNEDINALVGRYTPVPPVHPDPLCVYTWDPEYYDVTEDMFVEVEGFTKAHVYMQADLYFVLVETCEVPPTVPVELSSFTAVVTGGYVKLNWVTQTETGMLGYRVYRNNSDNQETAMMITPIMIPATNTSSTQTYTFEDMEVENGTYWYWLESVDYNTSNFHGPTTVIVQGEIYP